MTRRSTRSARALCHSGEGTARRAHGGLVFEFAHTPKALMECPIYDNAIYVIGSYWEPWSRMTEQELTAYQSGEVKRIPHQGDGFGKGKQELEIR